MVEDTVLSPSRRNLLLMNLAAALLAVVADYFSGPTVHFPIIFALPIWMVTWWCGLRWGITWALLLPLIRLSFMFVWEEPRSGAAMVANALIRMSALCGLALLVSKAAARTRALVQETRLLKGLLPICSFCKKIRGDDGNWQQLEQYITDHSEAVFSHGLCLDCAKEHYGDLLAGLSPGAEAEAFGEREAGE